MRYFAYLYICMKREQNKNMITHENCSGIHANCSHMYGKMRWNENDDGSELIKWNIADGEKSFFLSFRLLDTKVDWCVNHLVCAGWQESESKQEKLGGCERGER